MSVITYTAQRNLIGAGTNLLSFPEDFDNAYWTKIALQPFGSGSVADAIAAPDGSVTADKIVEDATNNLHGPSLAVAGLTDNATYTFSIHGKGDARSWLRVRTIDKTNTVRSFWVNISTGAAGNVDAGVVASSLAAAANNFFRAGISINVGAGATTPTFQAIMAMSNGGGAYLGDGVSGLYLWGAMLHAGATLLDYPHSAGKSYNIEFTPRALNPTFPEISSSRTEALDKTAVTRLFALSKFWDVTTGRILETDIPAWEEFLASAAAGEYFTFDPKGTIAAPVAPVTCELVSVSHPQTRLGTTNRYTISMKFRVIG